MKNWTRKISISLMLAVFELLLGILLLVNPVGLTSFVITALGVIVLLLGVLHLYRYIRLPREEAAKTWKLAIGTGLLAVGIFVMVNQPWMVEMLGTLTTLYGVITIAAAFMKLQISVDALRGKRPYWYLMAISFLMTAVLATLLFVGTFAESAVWIMTGIILILLAVLDVVYFILGRRKKEKEES